MKKILLAVDGSPSAQHATRTLIESLKQYKEAPELHLVTVHRPVPNIGNAGPVLTKDMLDRYYQDECNAALAPSVALLKDANIVFVEHRLVGEIAQTIIETATKYGCENIVMGTRGHSAVANLVLGSIATKVLHFSKVPVTLVH